MPKVEYRSNAKPSVYAPPPLLEEKKREEKERVTAAVLSITARAKRREAAHASKSSTQVTPAAAVEKMDVDTDDKAEDKKKEEAKPKEEPSFEILSNPARVVRQQVIFGLTKTINLIINGEFGCVHIVEGDSNGRELEVCPAERAEHRWYHRNALLGRRSTRRPRRTRSRFDFILYLYSFTSS